MADSSTRPAEEKPARETKSSADFSFRRRALVEAARYGSDPWVFVRELLQNARDAGARRVVFETTVERGMARIICRDDGVGMAYSHAERYLFALYASSKEDEVSQAGQFGIGFWSVLRFCPSSITVRSRTLEGQAWQVVLDGELENARIEEETVFEVRSGTEIILERPLDQESVGDQESVSDQVLRAARHHGRFLTQRPGPGRARGEQDLEVIVDGQTINEPFALPSPSVNFEGRGFRGVVALGSEPSVELFAHGLFVRSAKSLEELLDGERRRGGESTEDALAELPSLAPRILLDSDEVELLLARSDARQDRHLSQLVRRAERELSRLVQRKLDSFSPQPWYRVWLGALRERLEDLEGRPLAVALVIGVVLGSVLGLGLARYWSTLNHEGLPAEVPWEAGKELLESLQPLIESDSSVGETRLAESLRRSPPTGERTDRPAIHPYRDLAKSYRGPRIDAERPGRGFQPLPALLYQPTTESVLFNALVVDDLASGRPLPVAVSETMPYRPVPCTVECLVVQMMVEADVGLLRLPIPTGHRLTTSLVRLEGTEYPVFETPQGEAVLRITRPTAGFLEYSTMVAQAPKAEVPPPLQTPEELIAVAARLSQRPQHEQISGALHYVSQRVLYSRSQETVHAFQKAQRAGGFFLDAALAVGAGDCDVQNGVLTALLREMGIESRLVLGYVGRQGHVAPGLHAWVEVRENEGPWRAIDASLETPTHPLPRVPPSMANSPHPLPRNPVTTADLGVPAGEEEMPKGQKLNQPRWYVWSWPLLIALGILALGWFLLRRRRIPLQGVPDLGESGNLAALLGGALRHPTAFAAMPAVFHGHFVPLIGSGKALSLHTARRLAEEQRLFRSDAGSEFAQQAADKGISVVDGGTPEGAVLSRAFGAIDLDHWGDLLSRCYETESTRRIGRTLQQLGASWRIRESPKLPEAVVEISLEDLRLGQRLVLFDLDHPDFARARPATESAKGDFALLDLLSPRLDLESGTQSRVLAHFAAAALEEAAAESRR